jgi:hypothetical protein
MTFDSAPSSADNVTDVTPNQLVKVPRKPLDFPRVEAVVVRMTLHGFIQLAKAEARVYLANLRAVEANKSAVYTEPEARAVMSVSYTHLRAHETM